MATLERQGIDGAARSPWFFPSAKAYRALLEEGAFRLGTIALFARPTPLPTAIEGWLRTFEHPFLAGLDAATKGSVLDEVEASLRPVLRDASGRWTADYVRLRFAATLA